MFRFVCLCALVFAVNAQQGRYVDDPRVAAILTEQRYLSGDGTFGAAYTQEDGVDFKEESDAAGNRKGSYSYVDPQGQRRTVTYTAGKNGFVASGDHLPVAPQAPAQVAPQARYNSPPQQYSQAPQQYSQAPQQYSQAPQQFSNAIPNEDDGQYYPELYEKESTGQQQKYNQPQPQYNPAPQPQYNPAPQQQRYSGVQQPAYVAPRPQQQYSGAPSVQAQYSGVQSASPRPQQLFNPEPTQPSRYFPPGKLDLNRSQDGFAYSFSSKF